ncbi:MAG: LysR family transcriptional regulator [Desulfobacteraceae bacterium]|nr:MAG: LysR family transcriptional regulator [Desulfobacteraceae bacterium]
MNFDDLPSLNALRAFESVARHLSFTRAADELCVTQGAVSRQVKNLEEELGIQLFSRVPNRLGLTSDGENLYHSAHSAFKQIQHAKQAILEKHSKLNIIAAPTFATRWLSPRLYRFQERNPELQILLETTVKKRDFRYYSNFDAALTYGEPEGQEDLVVAPLFREALYPACSPKLLSSSRPLKRIEDLSSHTILHSSLDRTEWRAWAGMMGLEDFRSSGEQFFELEESSIQAAKVGSGICLVNIYFVQDEILSRNLVLPFPHIPALLLNSYCLVYQKSKSSAAPLKRFRDWIFMELAQFMGEER